MNLRLLGDRVLVSPDKAQEKVRGLWLVEKWRGPVTAGTVAAIGSEVERRGLSLAVGQRVLVKPHTGVDFEWSGIRYRMFECAEILMVLSGLPEEVVTQ